MIKQLVKEILTEEMTGKKQEAKVIASGKISDRFIGKVCMFRTYSAGVHFGELVEKDGQECLVKDARRVYYWTHACSLSQLAMEGSKDLKNCKIAMMVNEIILDQVIEIIPIPDDASKHLYGAAEWKK